MVKLNDGRLSIRMGIGGNMVGIQQRFFGAGVDGTSLAQRFRIFLGNIKTMQFEQKPHVSRKLVWVLLANEQRMIIFQQINNWQRALSEMATESINII